VDERFGLTNQIRRAAVSVASNIAEGKGRVSDKELLQFLSRARGSLYEVETQIKVAALLTYLTSSQVSNLIQCSQRVGCLLNGLMRSLRVAYRGAKAESGSRKPRAGSREPEAERPESINPLAAIVTWNRFRQFGELLSTHLLSVCVKCAKFFASLVFIAKIAFISLTSPENRLN